MPNFEKYNKLHNEVIKRLKDGKITTEQAKEVHDKIFNKYIIESGEVSIQNKILKLKLEFETDTSKLLSILNNLYDKMNTNEKAEYSELKSRYNDFAKKLKTIEFTNYNEFLKESDKLHSDMGKLAISIQKKK